MPPSLASSSSSDTSAPSRLCHSSLFPALCPASICHYHFPVPAVPTAVPGHLCQHGGVVCWAACSYTFWASGSTPPHSSCSLNPSGAGEPRSMFLAKQRHCNVGHCLNCRVPCFLEVSGGHSQILGAGPRRGLQGIKSLT